MYTYQDIEDRVVKDITFTKTKISISFDETDVMLIIEPELDSTIRWNLSHLQSNKCPSSWFEQESDLNMLIGHELLDVYVSKHQQACRSTQHYIRTRDGLRVGIRVCSKSEKNHTRFVECHLESGVN